MAVRHSWRKNPDMMAEDSQPRYDRNSHTDLERKEGMAGLLLLGVVLGGLVGWGFGNVIIGLLVGFALALVLSVVHLLSVRSGVVYLEEFEPKPEQDEPGIRNHIICIDGTWNNPEIPTNVRHFYDHLEVKDGTTPAKDGTRQLARYYSGVGARENIGFGREFLGKKYSKTMLGGGTGYGAQAIMWRTYFEFVRDYQPGDRIVIVGFSRGAAIARMLASFISEKGIPGYVALKCRKKSMEEDAIDEIQVDRPHEHGSPEVEMLGVWDTVAAFGLPWNKIELFKGRDLKLAERVKKAYHLVAIDEVRKTFDVTLFDHDDRVEEIWFPGAHTNVGGGWREKGDEREERRLSDLALRFMIDRAKEHGVVFDGDADTIQGDASGPIWKAGPMWLWRIDREICVQGAEHLPPKIHPSVYQRMDIDGGYPPVNLSALKFPREELEDKRFEPGSGTQ